MRRSPLSSKSVRLRSKPARQLHDRQRDIVRTAAGRLQAHIERNSDEWLRAEFGSDPSGRADAAAAIAALGDILPKCLPDGLKVAQANLDTERIAGLVVAKAGAGDEMFRKDTFGERLLRCLVQRAYEEAKRDRDFAAVIGITVQQVLLRADRRSSRPVRRNYRMRSSPGWPRRSTCGERRAAGPSNGEITQVARRLRPMRCSISIRRSSNSKERSTWHWMSSPRVSVAPTTTRLSILFWRKSPRRPGSAISMSGAQAVEARP